MTPTDPFETRIDLANDRLLTLQRQAAVALNLDTQPIFVAALGDLSTALEELHVIAEELNERNAELLATRADLDAERQHYQDLFEFAPDGYLLTSPTGVIEEANQAAANLLGVSADYLTGKPLVVFVAKADRPQLYATLRQAGRDAAPLDRELLIQSRQNEARRVAVKVAASHDAGGRVNRLRWMMRDITDRIQAEEALRQSEARAQAMLRTIPDLMFRLDRQGVFLDYKADIQDLYTQTSPIGLRNRDIAPPDFADLIEQQIDLTLQTRTLHTFEYQLPLPGRGLRDYEARMTPSGDNEVTAIVRDITNLKQAAAALRELNATLEQRVADRTHQLAATNDQLVAANLRLHELDQLKEQFISRISHELRTPLTSIKIYLEMLDRVSPEKRAQYMQTLTKQTNRLQALIENLLAVTEQSINPAGLHPVPTDLNQLVASLAADVSPRVTTHGLTLTTALAPDLPLVAADAILLSQALSNLTTNALNYTPAGGAIELSTSLVTDEAQTWLTVTVRDTGPGIALDEQAHIFDRFYRGRAAADYTVAGAGVGLSISRDILAALDGRLTVQSDGVPGHGAAFTAWLKAVA